MARPVPLRLPVVLAVAALVLGLAVVAVPAGAAGGVPPVGAQDPTSTSTTTPRAPSTSAPALQERVSESEEATTRLNRVVIALVALAAVISVVTIVFWRATRPEGAVRRGEEPLRWTELGVADGSGGEGRPALPTGAGPASSEAAGVPVAASADAADDEVRVVRRRRGGAAGTSGTLR